MNYRDLLKQYVSTGKELNEYQFKSIKNNSQLISSYFTARSKLLNLRVYTYDRMADYEIEFLSENLKYLKKFNVKTILINLKKTPAYSDETYNISKYLIESEMLDLNKDGMFLLYYYIGVSRVLDKIWIFIIDKVGNDINYDTLFYVAKETKNNDYMIKKVISKLDEYNISLYSNVLLSYSDDIDSVADLMLKKINKDYIKDHVIKIINKEKEKRKNEGNN
jgi:hypothetical protein